MSRSLSLRLTAVLLFAGVVAVLVAICTALFAASYREPPPAKFPHPGSQAEAMRQDLAYLRTLGSYDRSFSPAGRVEFDRRMDILEAKAASLDRAGLEMGAAWAMAAADNGHSNVRSASRGHALNALPLRFLWFADGLFVVKTTPELSELLGAQVVAQDGRGVEALAGELRKYMGGTASLARQYSTYFMESPQAMHAAGLSPQADRSTFDLVLANGATVTRTIIARPEPIVPDADDVKPFRDLSADRAAADRAAWRHVLDGRTPALYLRHPDQAFWRVTLPDGSIYVQLNVLRDSHKQPLKTFLRGVVDTARSAKPPAVIVDLRMNGGGDYLVTTGFTKALPAALPADRPIYVLTGPATFSAAIVTAARLKSFGGSRTYIAGEPVGDRPQYWGEGKKKLLPNSKIPLRYATAFHRHDRPCAILESPTCYWLDYLYPAVGQVFAPDLPARPTFQDYLAGRDVVMEAVDGALAAQRKAPAHG